MHRVEGDWLQLLRIDLSLAIQNTFAGGDIHDLAQQKLRLLVKADQFALQRHGKFADDRRVHDLTLGHMESGARHLIRCCIAGDDAHIVAGVHVARIRHADSKCFAVQDVLHRFMAAAEIHGDAVYVRDTAPRGVNGVRSTILAIGCDDQNRLRVQPGLCSKILTHSSVLLLQE